MSTEPTSRGWIGAFSDSRIVRITVVLLVVGVVHTLLHEMIHILVAMTLGEFQRFGVMNSLPQVIFKTDSGSREGLKWAVISGLPSVTTVAVGYGLFAARERLEAAVEGVGRPIVYWATFVFLLADPVNVAIGSFVYGGDAVGIALGLGVPVLIVQVVAAGIIVINRELIVRKLFALYEVDTSSPLWQPMSLGFEGLESGE